MLVVRRKYVCSTEKGCKPPTNPALPSGRLICFAEENIHEAITGAFAEQGDKFCHSHGYTGMVDMVDNADLVKIVNDHKGN